VRTLPGTLLRALAGIVSERHVLTGDAAAGFATDWTGRFRGETPASVRPGDTAEVAAVLALCTEAGPGLDRCSGGSVRRSIRRAR
jgi:FAD/FMN-containing dehydrogenase